jgi:diketogulonate reductase-like aldo/keto reductase
MDGHDVFFDVKKGVLLGVSNFETTHMRPMLYECNIVSVSLEIKCDDLFF